MTLKADGTNGIIQQYDYQVLTTAFTYTFAAGTTVLVINPAGTLATGTITFPAAPVDGMTVTFSSTQTITALTLAGNGKTIVSAATILPANQATTYVYRLSNTSWYPMTNVATNTLTSPTITGAVVSSMASSVITSGTAQASTSGTSIDFTGIPSWVKRITVMLNGVSTSGGDDYYLRLGTGGTPTYVTTGYTSTKGVVTSGGAVSSDVTAGFDIAVISAGAGFASGHAILTNVSGNIWVCSSNIGVSGDVRFTAQGGSITLGAALTAVRLTTSGGTNTFDAGSINILYE
jgi:hypothetical protein